MIPASGIRIEIVGPSSEENVKPLKIANISKQGMLLLSTQDIDAEELLCRIHCPGSETPLEIVCKVKHKAKPDGELYRIGVYFPDMSESLAPHDAD